MKLPARESQRARLGAICSSAWFGNIATALVLLNLLIMAMPYEGMSAAYAAGLERAAAL